MQKRPSAFPNDIPVLVDFTHMAGPMALNQQISILKQPCEGGVGAQLPSMDHRPLIINQVGRLASGLMD